MVGEIHLAKIYFTDLSAYKIRPVLILKAMDEDYICLQISSQIKSDRIIITNSDMVDGQLKKESVVVVPKNFTLHKSIFSKYIGKINNDLFTTIFQKFCKDIGCDS
jgi:mRNA interferase MazF